MQQGTQFLPISREDMRQRGWDELDFVLVMGDAYVDHPSFGPAIIGRILEAEGYRVGVISQPDYTTCESFKVLGSPATASLSVAAMWTVWLPITRWPRFAGRWTNTLPAAWPASGRTAAPLFTPSWPSRPTRICR